MRSDPSASSCGQTPARLRAVRPQRVFVRSDPSASSCGQTPARLRSGDGDVLKKIELFERGADTTHHRVHRIGRDHDRKTGLLPEENIHISSPGRRRRRARCRGPRYRRPVPAAFARGETRTASTIVLTVSDKASRTSSEFRTTLLGTPPTTSRPFTSISSRVPVAEADPIRFLTSSAVCSPKSRL